jgi:hypothetical protein
MNEKEISWLIYGEYKDRLNQQIFDNRDLANNKNPYFNHYITFKNLQPNKRYFFKIVTPQGVIKQNNNLPFSFVTKIQLPLPTSLSPAMGIIQDENGRSLINGIVLLKIEGVEPLSDTTKDKGEWLIAFYYLTKINTSELIQPKRDSLATIEIISEEGKMSTVKTILNKTSPLPQTIVIGKNYDFTKKEENVLSVTTSNQAIFKKIDIISPEENKAIPGKRPIFRGTALPNKKIKIVIESTNHQVFEIYSDKDGLWGLTPFYDLDPGEHRMTIITEDENGNEVKITRTFNVLKSGESVLGEATPSATLTPTIMPTQTPISTLTPTPQVSPTQAPKSGTNFLPLALTSTALVILGAGLIMVF